MTKFSRVVKLNSVYIFIMKGKGYGAYRWSLQLIARYLEISQVVLQIPLPIQNETMSQHQLDNPLLFPKMMIRGFILIAFNDKRTSVTNSHIW